MSSNKSRIRKALKRFAPKVYYGKYFKRERLKWHGGGKPIYMFTPNPDHVLQSGIYEDLGKMGVKVSTGREEMIKAILNAPDAATALKAVDKRNQTRPIPHDGC